MTMGHNDNDKKNDSCDHNNYGLSNSDDEY